MSKMSLIDKLNIFLEVSKTSKLFIVVLIALVILAFIFFRTNKKNAKTSKKIYLIVYIFVLLFVIISFNKSLASIFDYMMNNLFIAIYFPNLAIYFAAIIATNIILWISIFNFKTDKLIKNINIIVYCLMNYLLVLILSIINTEKLDVFTQTSVYGNKQAQALIELSSGLFIIWIIFLIIYKIIRIYQNRNKTSLEKAIIEEKRSRVLPNNITEIKAPRYAQALPKKPTIKPQPQPTKVQQQAVSEIDKLLTLDDYKLLLTILKEKKEKDRSEKEAKEKIEQEQSKFMELQELYRSVR